MWKVFLIVQLAHFVSCPICNYLEKNFTRTRECTDSCCSDGTCCDFLTVNQTLLIALGILGGVGLVIILFCLVCYIKLKTNKTQSRRVRPEHSLDEIGVPDMSRSSAMFGIDNRRHITFVKPPPYASSPPPYSEEYPVTSSGLGINPVFSNTQQPRSASGSFRTLPNRPPPSYAMAVVGRARATPYPR